MNDSFVSYDPFDVGLPFDDPLPGPEDQLDPFNDPLNPFGHEFVTEPFSHDLMFDMASSPGLIIEPSGMVESVVNQSELVIEPNEHVEHLLVPNLENALEPVPDAAPDILDGVEDSMFLDLLFSGPPVSGMLDALEDYIEEGKPSDHESILETWPQSNWDIQGNEQRSENQCDQQFYGVNSPDPKIDSKPENGHERHLRIRTWRPRSYSGFRRSSSSEKKPAGEAPGKKTIDDDEARECPATGETVALAECESCEHFLNGECTFQPEEENGNSESSKDME